MLYRVAILTTSIRNFPEFRVCSAYSEVRGSDLRWLSTALHIPSSSSDGRNDMHIAAKQHHRTERRQAVAVVCSPGRPCSTSFPVQQLTATVFLARSTGLKPSRRSGACTDEQQLEMAADCLPDRVKIVLRQKPSPASQFCSRPLNVGTLTSTMQRAEKFKWNPTHEKWDLIFFLRVEENGI